MMYGIWKSAWTKRVSVTRPCVEFIHALLNRLLASREFLEKFSSEFLSRLFRARTPPNCVNTQFQEQLTFAEYFRVTVENSGVHVGLWYWRNTSTI